MNDQRKNESSDAHGGESAPLEPVSRRALLRGVAIAAPTILTVNTASATLAMSSVRTYTSRDYPQADGKYYCLANEGTLGVPPPGTNVNQLQLNSMSTPIVQPYGDRDWRVGATGSSLPVTEVQMCKDTSGTYAGPTYYVNSSGWKQVTIKKGIMLSAAAMTSLGVVSPIRIDNF